MFLALSFHAEAQQPKKIPLIGYLAIPPPAVNEARNEAFRQGRRELVCCPGNSYTQPFKFCQYRVSGGGPAERATVAVVVLDELIDATDQIFNTAEGPATNGSLGDQGKPSFDLIKP